MQLTSGKIFEMVSPQKLQVRNDGNIAHYLHNPDSTPEDQLITVILVPSA
jgi:hypothetical protein